MQTTIYYRENDQYLVDKLEEMARRQRKSKSACLLSLIEQYFEAEKKVGEILYDIGAVTKEKIDEALHKQEGEGKERKLGEILLEEGYVRELDLDRALEIQTSRKFI